jgi:hypothetical protein
VTDPWTIRLAFLLCLLGIVAAATGSWLRELDRRS